MSRATALLARLVPKPLTTLGLVAGWAALANSLAPGTLAMGLLLGLLIPQATARFNPSRTRPASLWAAGRYLLLVLRDIAVANIQVARIVLFKRNAELRPAFMAVPLDLATPEAVAVLAGTITMTPGTLSADLSSDGRTLLIHGLDVPDPQAVVADIKERYEARLRELLE